MIDIKVLRDHPDLIRESQRARGASIELVDLAIAADQKRRSAIVEFERVRAEQNSLSKSIGSAKGDEKSALLAKAKDLASAVKEADALRAEAEDEAEKSLAELANIADTRAPIGGEEDFVVLEEVGRNRYRTRRQSFGLALLLLNRKWCAARICFD
jgi:seryl-tRNA synthetase